MKCFNVLRCIATVLAIALAGAVPSTARADTVTDWNAIMQATVTASPTNANYQARGARSCSSPSSRRSTPSKAITNRTWGSSTARMGLAGRRCHRRGPSHPGDPAPGQGRGPRRPAGRLARGDPGRPGEGCRHCGRRGRRGRHASAPGQRRLGCRGALHAGNRSRGLAAGASLVRAGPCCPAGAR